MDPQSHDYRMLVDSNMYGEFRLPIHGTEGITVRSINPGCHPVLIEVSIAQVTLYGPLPAIRERLAVMVDLLDRVLDEPERWDDVRPTRVGARAWKRLRPHPFADRPTTPTSAADSGESQDNAPTVSRAPIIPIRRRRTPRE